MAKKHVALEQIIAKLREAEVLVARGKILAHASKRVSVMVKTYFCWRKEYCGLKTDRARRLKKLKREKTRLKRLLADVI